jgi:hypothetical protein
MEIFSSLRLVVILKRSSTLPPELVSGPLIVSHRYLLAEAKSDSKVADKFPSASVVGVDLSPIQPSWVPPNLKFLVDDIEDEWMHGDDFDFVHMRCISPWLKDEVKLLRQAHEYD